MKCSLASSALIVLGLTACDTFDHPITGGDFDPLNKPGGGSGISTVPASSFSAGQLVRAAMNNTAFFKTRPKGEADADRLLVRGTTMKVISTSDSYVKVELDGTGEIGWIPSVQLEDPRATQSSFVTKPGEYQIYPPIGGGAAEALPPVDPSGKPPEGAIPTVIDPDAARSNKPVPALTPPNGTFPTPKEPKTGPTPLPPNGEEIEAAKKAKGDKSGQ